MVPLPQILSQMGIDDADRLIDLFDVGPTFFAKIHQPIDIVFPNWMNSLVEFKHSNRVISSLQFEPLLLELFIVLPSVLLTFAFSKTYLPVSI